MLKLSVETTSLRLPRQVWMLGLVSLFMDLSSEMIHALLPVYLVTVMGASALNLGLIEGVAEATAAIVKVFAGALSDRLGKRKVLAAFGYGLSALTKPIFPLADHLSWIVAARFIDRIGKGIRGAPRDALLADIAPPTMRGASFGLRQSLDTIGAFLGPLVAIALLAFSDANLKHIFWIAVVPAFISFGLMAFAIKEPAHIEPNAQRQASKPPVRWADARRLTRDFWILTLFAAILTLARFSEAFLALRAQNLGASLALIPLALVVMNLVYAASAYPVGVLSDNIGAKGLLAVGLGFLIAANLILAVSRTLPEMIAGIILWGLHMGFTQGLLASLVAAVAPENMRGTAFGVFNLACAAAMLGASVIAGALWEFHGPVWTFAAGAIFSSVALAGLMRVSKRFFETA